MRVSLLAHPDWNCTAIDAVTCDVARPAANRLVLDYRVSGRIKALRVPAPASPLRTDDLWRHTCFEAFVQDGDAGYREYNFSPSTQWAAYRFTAYRDGMTPEPVATPQIVVAAEARSLRITAAFDISPGAARAGLAAVIEDGAGWKSYWALRHPAGKADFHHADGFALTLPPPGQS